MISWQAYYKLWSFKSFLHSLSQEALNYIAALHQKARSWIPLQPRLFWLVSGGAVQWQDDGLSAAAEGDEEKGGAQGAEREWFRVSCVCVCVCTRVLSTRSLGICSNTEDRLSDR